MQYRYIDSRIGECFGALLPRTARQCLSFVIFSGAILFAVPAFPQAVTAAQPPSSAVREPLREPTREAPELATGVVAKQAVSARHSMVVAAHPLAVEAGLKMLDQGGAAIDATIAVQLVLNLIEAHASGIGGGAFIMHFDARKNSVAAYDGREEAPMAATPELFLGKDGKPMRFVDAVIGGKSVGVPGLLRALEMAHAKHGKLKWAQLFEPAIDLAENGYPLVLRLQRHLENETILRNNPNAKTIFYNEDGSLKPMGAKIKNPQFAAVLKRIAKEGADAFYEGEIARDIVAAVQGHATNPGGLSEADLSRYKARAVEPVCGNYRTYKVCGMPPPSSGGVAVLQMLQTLERFDLKSVRPNSAEAVHLFSEAGRLVYADRDRYIGDDRFVSVPVAGLIDPSYNKARSQLIAPEKSMGKAEAGIPAGIKTAMVDGDTLEFPSTSHISVVDRDGNAVSMTTSIESFFGSRLFVHGFPLNNQLTDFSMTPTENGRPVANAVAPGKRPRSAMSPTLVFSNAGPDKGKLVMVIGSAGGSAIINYLAKAIVGVLDWGMDIQTAISHPNMGSRNGPTDLERATSAEQLAATLKAMGHETRVVDLSSGTHGILRTVDGWQAGADPRREGVGKGR